MKRVPLIGIFAGSLLTLLFLIFNRVQPHTQGAFEAGQPAILWVDMGLWGVAIIGVVVTMVSAVVASKDQANAINDLQDEIRQIKILTAQFARKDDLDHIKQSILEKRSTSSSS